MGLADDLGYRVNPPNALQRGVQRVASSSLGARLSSKLLHPVDKALFGVTRGRVTVASVLSGLPVIMLTTTGARSGEQRPTPLIGIPLRDDLALIGTNWGTRPTPGWVYNLEADPTATVAYGNRTVTVTARRADEDEADEVFAAAAAVYGGYGRYRARVDERVIRVFVLEPAP